MAQADTARHFGFIDAVRGVAACAVMIEHALEQAGFLRIESGHFGLSWLNLGEVGVVAFFFVSGFVIPMSLEKRGSASLFWVNRIFRIYPLYLSLYAVSLALFLFSGRQMEGFLTNVFSHFFFVQEFFNTPNFIGVAWTLSLEAVWYVVFTVLFLLSLNQRGTLMAALAILFGLIACAVSIFLFRLPMGRVGLLLVCWLGLLCLRRESGQIGRDRFLLLSALIAATIVAGLVVGFWLRPSALSISPSLRCVLISWALGAGLFWTAFFYRSWGVINNRVARYLGTTSYSIYLLHPLVMAFVAPPLAGVAFSPYLTVLAIVVVTIIVSGFTYRYIEKPAIDLSHRLRRSSLQAIKV